MVSARQPSTDEKTSASPNDPAPLEDSKTPHQRREVKREHFINKLNYINFQDAEVHLLFKHAKYDKVLSVSVKPMPCYEDTLDCQWAGTEGIPGEIKNYKFHSLHIPDGQLLTILKPKVAALSEKGIRFELPELGWEQRVRKIHRHVCREISVMFIQNSAVFSGRLVDFNADTFRVEIAVTPPQTFQWIYPEAGVHIIFSNDRQPIYSGECQILRQTFGQHTRTFVLKPVSKTIRRFKPKQFRSFRQEFEPLPDINFRHPLTGKYVSLKVSSLSGSGFSVEENRKQAVLLPGLILPEVELSFANSFTLACTAQILYQHPMDDENPDKLKCGVALLDMDMEDHARFLALLNQAKNKHAYIGNIVDPDALWSFFFETGFIYPKKYEFVHSNKEKIKATYEKLYTQSPRIARHFIYQENGRILGHMAMVRYHGNAWMIHHHAANKSESNRAGIVVLSQIHHYLNDTYKIHSAHLDMVFCYFRPENKFPSRVFGGATKYMKSSKGSSVDRFAYLHFKNGFYNELDLPSPWELMEPNSEDLLELDIFYEHESGGLMLNALGMGLDIAGDDSVDREYQRLGFKKERRLFSLKKDGKLTAMLIVNFSDIGLNLSDLTNCIQVFVLDPESLDRKTLRSVIFMLYSKFDQTDMPVMLYPVEYAESQAIDFEKQYTLWVLNLQYLDSYFKYIQRLLRAI